MLESKAIKTVISAILTARTLISVPDLDSPQRQFHHVCFATIYSITLYSSPPSGLVQSSRSPMLPLSDWWGKHIWTKSWQLSSFILATHPSVTQQHGGTSAKKKQQGSAMQCLSACVYVCVPWRVSLWVCVCKCKNSPINNFPRLLHTALVMLHVWLIVWKKEGSPANLREEAKEKWAGPLGEKLRGLSNGLLPKSTHMDGT